MVKGASMMTKKTVNMRWSYADDRRLMQLAASSKSVKEIANEMNRPPEKVVRMAMRLGISLKFPAKRNLGQMNPSTPWTAGEQEKLEDLLRAGKDVGEIATVLRRTRQAIYVRLRRLGVKSMRSWRVVDRS
jgi:hypothetical protein